MCEIKSIETESEMSKLTDAQIENLSDDELYLALIDDRRAVDAVGFSASALYRKAGKILGSGERKVRAAQRREVRQMQRQF